MASLKALNGGTWSRTEKAVKTSQKSLVLVSELPAL
jgi:hypothetical protein